MAKRKRRAFTPEFKAEAVLCRVGDRTVRQVAKHLDLTETALRDWVKRAKFDAGPGPSDALTTAEREELTRLRREIKRLQMERDVLRNSPRARSYLLNQKLPRAHSRRGSGGAAGCFSATTAIP